MKIGTVFIWKKYTHLINEDEKNIYGLYFGESGPLDDPPFVIFHKLTSKTYYYETGGNRSNHRHYRFSISEYDKLKKDSIFDFEFTEEIVSKDEFLQADIVELFTLPVDKIRMLYNNIKETFCRYTLKIKIRIHDNLNNEGLTGLQQPKRKLRN